MFYSQPFSVGPRKEVILFCILCIWTISLAIAVGPLLEQEGHTFYHLAMLKDDMFFQRRDVSFDALKSFALRLFTFHSGLVNASSTVKENVLKVNSWTVLQEFLGENFSKTFNI